MIRRTGKFEGTYRHSGGKREALAATGQGPAVHYQPSGKVGIGCITSRPRPSVTFFELLAYELGCNVTTAKDLYDRGMIQ